MRYFAQGFVLLCAAAISSPAQTFTTLLNFDGTNGTETLYMSLVQGVDGNFYGRLGLAAQMAMAPSIKSLLPGR